jgi:hypothetical protein
MTMRVERQAFCAFLPERPGTHNLVTYRLVLHKSTCKQRLYTGYL